MDTIKDAYEVVKTCKYNPLTFCRRCAYYDSTDLRQCLIKLYINPDCPLSDGEVASEGMQAFYRDTKVLNQIKQSVYSVEQCRNGLLHIQFVTSMKVTRTTVVREAILRKFNNLLFDFDWNVTNCTISNFTRVRKFESVLEEISNKTILMGQIVAIC